MAKLPENTPDSLPEWRDVFQLETTTRALGGEPEFDGNDEPIDGHMNAPIKQLMDRTTLLNYRNGSNVRNCVLTGNILDNPGTPVQFPYVLQQLSDTTMKIEAGVGNEVVISFANGFGKFGPQDYIAAISADVPVDVTGILGADGSYILIAEYDKETMEVSFVFGATGNVGLEIAAYPPVVSGVDAVEGRFWWDDRRKKAYKTIDNGVDIVWQETCAVSLGVVTIDSGIIDSVYTYEFGSMYELGSEGAPVGTVTAYAGYSAPKGWLMCNGQSCAISAYYKLYAVIGTQYGGSTGAFNVPDLRGRFVRMFDYGAGRDAGRTFGDYQADDIAAHTHTVAADNTGGAGAGPYLAGAGSTNATVTTSSAGGASETRPKNLAMNYIIKY